MSSPFLTRVAGYLQSMDKRVTPHLLWRHGSPLALRVVHGVTGHLLSCVWNLWFFPDDAQGCQCPFVLCLHPQGCLQRGVRASGSFKSVPENWGLSACGTTHEATSRISSGDWPHPEVRREGRKPLADKAGESTHRSRSEGEKGLK